MEKEIIIDIPGGHEADIAGPFDVNLKKIEKEFRVVFTSRDGVMRMKVESSVLERA